MVKSVLKQLKRGKLVFLGKPLFTALVTAELLWERLRDSAFSPDFHMTESIDANLTIVIKTFERPRTVKRLVESIRRFYPSVEIIVVDDSSVPLALEGVTVVSMPYDSGVSAGRNRGIHEVKTPYFLLLDDDFVFYRKTDLLIPLKKIMAHRKIDILGGEVLNLPLYTSTDYLHKPLYPTTASSLLPNGMEIDGMVIQDKVANFYIGRTTSVKNVGWDEKIKRLDHADFFTRAKGILVTAFTPTFKILHAQTPFDTDYMKRRNDVDADRAVLYRKYYA